MFHETLTVQRKENVMLISIAWPGDIEKMARLPDELAGLCTEITWDKKIWMAVITCDGEKSFSMGKLLGEAASSSDKEEKIRISFAEPTAKLDKPVIAAIHGDAIGQGLELTLACDIRIAAGTSRFGLPQIKSGIMPWDGGTQRLSRLIGRGKALEMILTGEVIDAQEALRIGLVNKVVPKKDLTEVTMKLAKEMASKGPIALRYTKEAIYKGMDMTLEQGLRLEADLYLLIHTTKDRTEGVQAFREKRTPKFEGK